MTHTSDLPRTAAGLAIAYRVIAMVCVACLGALVKWTGQHGIPVFEIILFRNVFAFVPLGLYVWRTTGFSVLRTRRPGSHLMRSAIGGVGMFCAFAAVQHLPLTEATALQFTSPLIMTALSALVLRETVGLHRWGAVIIGFLGVLVMERPNFSHLNIVGVVLALGAAAFQAGSNAAARQISATEKGPTIIFYYALSGTLLGAIGSAFHWVTPDATTLALLIGVGLLGGLTQHLFTEALRLASLHVVAPFDYSQLIWAMDSGFLVWGELPHPATVIGAIVVAGSGFYIARREMERARPEHATALPFEKA